MLSLSTSEVESSGPLWAAPCFPQADVWVSTVRRQGLGALMPVFAVSG